ncbi:MAG: 50S ribosomal protein L24 [Candidatus Taylorbacteria bacterium CG11_big_fil_rev_8_21_14_0_20_46_11]|uniref:Large ribosomal subunit protein uL24 n=1 Tax=Candidatus Taylorbacteria bacterium CG11_big_fil_rev_8_21_14_0_20_46_11 TaxID=1975025 RepID=A0A2H0KCY8_9BACT|nr:MAG: 50S ribosomal protein L24 [Candidatus Taylorbacteria bacterium CG11_big_fil_rev_8_21_14_0_20_46_11]
MSIHKGDNVIVTSGSSKGKKGVIARVLPEADKVIIEGVNLRKKHRKARKTGQKGQVIEVAMPIHVSNVALEDGGKPIRLGKKLVGGKWLRVNRKTGKEI